jgi:malonate transporter and related proteins
MSAIIEIVLPVFGVILCGYVVGKTPLLGPEGLKGFANFVFCVAIPALLFRTIARGTGADMADFSLVYSYFLGCLIVFGLALAVGRALFRLPLQDLGVFGMGAVFSNTVMLAIPLIYTAFGDEGLTRIMFIVTFHSMILIPLATVVVEIGRGSMAGVPVHILRSTLISLAKNPVIVSMVAGLAWAYTGWGLPGPVDKFLELLGGGGVPCSLFALGASLTTFHLGGGPRQSAALLILKLGVHPTVAWFLASQVFALDPLSVSVAVVTAALPTGINVFILAQRYDRYVARSATAVLVSTVVSAVTVAALLGFMGVR